MQLFADSRAIENWYIFLFFALLLFPLSTFVPLYVF